MFKVKKTIPQHLNENEISQLLVLHMNIFNMDRDTTMVRLMDKNAIYLLIDAKIDKIVGIIAFRYHETPNHFIMYIGNAVIDPEYQHNGFMYKVMISEAMRAFVKYPLKEKYITGGFTTPKVYNVTRHFPTFFPRADACIPEPEKNVMDIMVKEVLPDMNCVWENGVCLMKNLRSKGFKVGSVDCALKSHDGYFEKINPDFHIGDQLLMVIRLCPSIFLHGVKLSMCSYKRRLLKLFNGFKIPRQLW